MLRDLTENVDNTKGQMDSREIKNTVPEMKDAFDGLVSRLHMAERIPLLEDITVETEKQREKRLNKNRTSKN